MSSVIPNWSKSLKRPQKCLKDRIQLSFVQACIYKLFIASFGSELYVHINTYDRLGIDTLHTLVLDNIAILGQIS